MRCFRFLLAMIVQMTAAPSSKRKGTHRIEPSGPPTASRLVSHGIIAFVLVIVAWISHSYLQPRAAVLGPRQAFQAAPLPTITSNRTGYRLLYPVLHQDAADVWNATSRPSGWSSGGASMAQELYFEALTRPALELIQNTLKESDIPRPGTGVIRGRLVDELGRPIANAFVDLVDSRTHLDALHSAPPTARFLGLKSRDQRFNHLKTRDDGTFTLVVPDHSADRRFYLRFRFPTTSTWSNRNEITSTRFVVTTESPIVSITVSRNIFEKYKLHYWPGAVALLMLGPRLIVYMRRKYQRLPGTCATCGYDLRGTASEVCSECGTPIPQKVRDEINSGSQLKRRRTGST